MFHFIVMKYLSGKLTSTRPHFKSMQGLQKLFPNNTDKQLTTPWKFCSQRRLWYQLSTVILNDWTRQWVLRSALDILWSVSFHWRINDNPKVRFAKTFVTSHTWIFYGLTIVKNVHNFFLSFWACSKIAGAKGQWQ